MEHAPVEQPQDRSATERLDALRSSIAAAPSTPAVVPVNPDVVSFVEAKRNALAALANRIANESEDPTAMNIPPSLRAPQAA